MSEWGGKHRSPNQQGHAFAVYRAAEHLIGAKGFSTSLTAVVDVAAAYSAALLVVYLALLRLA